MKLRGDAIRVGIVCAFLFLEMPVHAALPWLHVDGNAIKDPNGDVVVLRGIDMVDLGSVEEWHGGAINMIDRLTDKTDAQGSSPGWHTRVIRLCITPPDAVPGRPYPFNVNDTILYDLLRAVVDRCAQRDVYAIIDWHYTTDTFDHVASTSEFWTYMAPKFANDSHVLFELFQEPVNNVGNDAADWNSVRTDMQTWVNIVRTYAPDNLILVGTPDYCKILTPVVSNPISGTNIVYTSHLYPLQWLDDSWWPPNKDSFVEHVTDCHAYFPVFSTEWGFSETATAGSLNEGTISNYGQPLMDFLEGQKISHSAWIASYDWQPSMFWRPDNVWLPGPWELRCGQGEMGCFAKDMLYSKRNDDQPGQGFLDLIDFAYFAADWARTDCGPSNIWCYDADSNHDGSVLLDDLTRFLEYWLGTD